MIEYCSKSLLQTKATISAFPLTEMSMVHESLFTRSLVSTA